MWKEVLREKWVKWFGIVGVIVVLFAGCVSDVKKDMDTAQDKLEQASAPMEEPTSTEEAPQATAEERTEVSLGAGTFKCGQDFPSGRWRATTKGVGVFTVFDSDKRRKGLSVIGEQDGLGDGDYTFWIEDGDYIETQTKVKLIPID